jgi:hypothetical protein
MDSERVANKSQGNALEAALKKIATASSASSRAAIQDAQATRPSLHTRFVYDPAKGRA